MMRSILFSAALFVAAGSASAQDPFSAAKKAAQNAAAATNAHIEAEQRPDGGAQKTPAQKTQAQKAAPAPQSKAAAPAAKSNAKGTAKADAKPATAAPDTAGPPPTIYREVFDYTRDGRRDPFNSLLTTSDLRPAISDLKLTTILLDLQQGRRSVAILRDLTTNTQYRVNVGSQLGRMRVASIRSNAVIFTIEEFGTTRQDSLVLRDSTKVRK